MTAEFYKKKLEQINNIDESLYLIGYDKIAVVGEGNKVLNKIAYTRFPTGTTHVFGFNFVFVKYDEPSPKVSEYAEIFYYD